MKIDNQRATSVIIVIAINPNAEIDSVTELEFLLTTTNASTNFNIVDSTFLLTIFF